MLYWFRCDSCPRYFPTELTRTNHKRSVHPVMKQRRTEKHLCDFCSATLANSSKLYRHANKKHVDSVTKNWFACKVCAFFLPNVSTLTSHVKRHHPKYHAQVSTIIDPNISGQTLFLCNFCETTFSDREGLRDHLRRKHPQESTVKKSTTQCAFCQDSFANAELSYKHASSLHKAETNEAHWLTCTKCRLKIPSHCMQIVHKRTCFKTTLAEKSNIKCSYCQESFSNRGDFHIHANKAHKDLIIKANWSHCPTCDKHVPPEFVSHHQQFCNETNPDAAESPSVGDKGFTLKCQFCSQSFASCVQSKSNYFAHANNYHRAEMAAANWSLCYACDRYVTPESFSNHLVSCRAANTDPSYENGSLIECHFCSQTFSGRIRNYFKHANHLHRAEIAAANWVLCQACDKYIIPESFAHHEKGCKIANPNPGVNKGFSFQCQFCSQSFAGSKSNYFTHANSYHRAEVAAANWTLCHACDRYVTPESFKKHIFNCRSAKSEHLSTPDSELEDTPDSELEDSGCQACPTCSKLLEPGVDLHAHIDSCIKKSKRINCAYCPSTFAGRPKWLKHSNKEHREQLVESNWVACERCSQLLEDDITLKAHRSHCQKVMNRRPAVKRTTLPKPPTIRNKNIPCSFCTYVSPKNQTYYKHVNKLHPEMVANTWEACLKCDFRLPNWVALRLHQRQCDPEAKKEKNKEAKKFECQFCKKRFTRRESRLQHCRTEHPDKVESEWQPCPECHLLVPDDQQFLVRHMKMCVKMKQQLNTVPCDFCPEHFSKLAKYTKHVNEVHGPKVAESSWPVCEKCQKRIPKLWKMSRHQQSCKGL